MTVATPVAARQTDQLVTVAAKMSEEVGEIKENDDVSLPVSETSRIRALDTKLKASETTLQRNHEAAIGAEIDNAGRSHRGNLTADRYMDNREGPVLWKYLAVGIPVTVMCLGFAYVQSTEHPIYSTLALVFQLFVWLFMFLDYFSVGDDTTPDGEKYMYFYDFQKFFQAGLFGTEGTTIYLVLFAIAMTGTVVMRTLRDEKLVTADAGFTVIYFPFVVCTNVFGFCSFMAHWNNISYNASTNSFVHSIFIVMIFPYIIVLCCRWLRPMKGDKEQSYHSKFWYHQHPSHELLPMCAFVLNLAFGMFILMACWLVAIFADFCKLVKEGEMTAEMALTIFLIIGMSIMLTPLAPGTIVDFFAGIVFISIYYEQGMPKSKFYEAWFMSFIVMTLLHFTGACTQWYIGTWPIVQRWMQAFAPMAMLAASDAVLKDANFLMVGLIAFVFMDTMNGFNQGRINMEFWTQLLSEYSNIPNTIVYTMFGALVTVSDAKVYPEFRDQNAVLLPLLFLTGYLFAQGGQAFGLWALGSSKDWQAYWASREKFAIYLHFRKHSGAHCTEKGYEADIYELTSCNHSTSGDVGGNEQCLYNKVHVLHNSYLRTRDSRSSGKNTEFDYNGDQRLEMSPEYYKRLKVLTDDHYANLERFFTRNDGQKLDDGTVIDGETPTIFEDQGYVIHEAAAPEVKNIFQGETDLEASTIETVYFVVMLLMFHVCFWNFTVELPEAANLGLAVLNKVSMLGWVGFIGYFSMALFYYQREIVSMCMGLGASIAFACCGCPPCSLPTGGPNPDGGWKDEQYETKFATPEWGCKCTVVGQIVGTWTGSVSGEPAADNKGPIEWVGCKCGHMATEITAAANEWKQQLDAKYGTKVSVSIKNDGDYPDAFGPNAKAEKDSVD